MEPSFLIRALKARAGEVIYFSRHRLSLHSCLYPLFMLNLGMSNEVLGGALIL